MDAVAYLRMDIGLATFEELLQLNEQINSHAGCLFVACHENSARLSFLPNVNVSPYVIVRPSVCLSYVTFVHPTQAIGIFGNVPKPCGNLAICDLCIKITEIVPGEPLHWGLNPREVAKYSDFRHFEGYISETMQDIMIYVCINHQ